MEWVSGIFGILGVVSATIFGYAAFRRNRKSDMAANGKQSGILFTELGYIKSGVDDIKRKQERQDQQHIEVVSRLTAVESAAKQAHKRIDVIEMEHFVN